MEKSDQQMVIKQLDVNMQKRKKETKETEQEPGLHLTPHTQGAQPAPDAEAG